MVTLSEGVPNRLVEEIRNGRCVAFVGAGFIQPSRPSWHGLLMRLVGRIRDDAQRNDLQAWLGGKERQLSSRDYEAIGEAIRESLGEDFTSALRDAVNQPLSPLNEARLQMLREIPFHAILTTNFDDSLEGALPCGPAAYAAVLQRPTTPWWEDARWRGEERAEVPIVKLHGSIESARDLVLTTRAYRDRVHGTAGYQSFLRALFATHTVLYMGFSFTDAYINELRSATLALLGSETKDRPDYAILNDVPALMARHLENHEKLVPLTFDTTPKAGDGPERDFGGFDEWLERIYHRTNPRETLLEVLSQRRILWLDPEPRRNDYGFEVLTRRRDGHRIDQVKSLDEAVERLRVNRGPSHEGDAERYDLVITHFGFEGADPSNAERLLMAMRGQDLRAPVVVFSSGAHRERNRQRVLDLGALAYTETWPELFRTLHRLFEDGLPESEA